MRMLPRFASRQPLQVIDNYFGTDESETSDLGMDVGIRIIAGSVDNLIQGNVIANNNKGVVVVNGGGNTITENSIYDNGIGIDLGDNGATGNDFLDLDSGVNQLQNSPAITRARTLPNRIQLTYSVDSLCASSQYPLTIEFFVSDNNGQGKTLLGSDLYLSSEVRSSKSILLLGVNVLVGQKIVATATDANGNTSEFSSEFTAFA